MSSSSTIVRKKTVDHDLTEMEDVELVVDPQCMTLIPLVFHTRGVVGSVYLNYGEEVSNIMRAVVPFDCCVRKISWFASKGNDFAMTVDVAINGAAGFTFGLASKEVKRVIDYDTSPPMLNRLDDVGVRLPVNNCENVVVVLYLSPSTT